MGFKVAKSILLIFKPTCQRLQKTEGEIFKHPISYLAIMEIAEPSGSLDAGKRGGADAASSLAAQVTFIVMSG
jgi:hypothetical protein